MQPDTINLRFMNPDKIMRMICLACIVITLPACLKNKEKDTELSDDPTLASLTFAANDSIPHLDEAVFTIVNDSNLVYNPDSLPYQTRIDSVFPTFTFNAPSGGAILYCGDDTIVLTGNDTVDFSIQPVRLLNYAANGIDTMWYSIYVNVHQVNPDLYVWEQRNPKIYTHAGSNQKAIWFNDALYLFVSSGINNYLYTSADGSTWQQAADKFNGLPTYNNFKQLVPYDNKLYMATETTIYRSENGIDWTSIDMSANPFIFTSLLMDFDGKLWGIIQEKQSKEYYFAHTTDGTTWEQGAATPAGFPISDFACVTFTSRTKTPKALVLGGYSADNTPLNKRWTTENGNYWINLSIEQPSFGSLAGASLINYDGKLLLFGGTDQNGKLMSSYVLETTDEGLNWVAPDSTANSMPEDFALRTNQSVVVNEADKRIYIIGGQSQYQVFTDAWSGKVNHAYWE